MTYIKVLAVLVFLKGMLIQKEERILTKCSLLSISFSLVINTDGAFGKIHKRAVTDDYTSIQVRSWKEQSELKENLI